MSVFEFKMKTHSREDLTGKFPHLHQCTKHGISPEILKVVAGRQREAYYVAVCKDDACGKISYSAEETVAAWNKWNPK